MQCYCIFYKTIDKQKNILHVSNHTRESGVHIPIGVTRKLFTKSV